MPSLKPDNRYKRSENDHFGHFLDRGDRRTMHSESNTKEYPSVCSYLLRIWLYGIILSSVLLICIYISINANNFYDAYHFYFIALTNWLIIYILVTVIVMSLQIQYQTRKVSNFWACLVLVFIINILLFVLVAHLLVVSHSDSSLTYLNLKYSCIYTYCVAAWTIFHILLHCGWFVLDLLFCVVFVQLYLYLFRFGRKIGYNSFRFGFGPTKLDPIVKSNSKKNVQKIQFGALRRQSSSHSDEYVAMSEISVGSDRIDELIYENHKQNDSNEEELDYLGKVELKHSTETKQSSSNINNNNNNNNKNQKRGMRRSGSYSIKHFNITVFDFVYYVAIWILFGIVLFFGMICSYAIVNLRESYEKGYFLVVFGVLLFVAIFFKWILKKMARLLDTFHLMLKLIVLKRNNKENKKKNDELIGLHSKVISVELLTEIFISSVYFLIFRLLMLYDVPSMQQFFISLGLHFVSEFIESIFKISKVYYDFTKNAKFGVASLGFFSDNSSVYEWRQRISIDFMCRFFSSMLIAMIQVIALVSTFANVKSWIDDDYNDGWEGLIYFGITIGFDVVYFTVFKCLTAKYFLIDMMQGFNKLFEKNGSFWLVCFATFSLLSLYTVGL